MIEVDKMLHLRRYVLTVLRADVKSRAAHILRSTSLSRDSTSSGEGGYVFRYLHHTARYVPSSMQPRPNYAVACIRTFDTTVAQSSIDDIEQKLTSFCDDAKHGRVSVDRLEEVIRLCDDSNHELHANTGVQLLKCCGNLSAAKSSKRQDLADRVWRLVQKNNDALTLDHYNALLTVYAENGSSVDPIKFLASMSVKPDENTYRLLLDATAKAGNTTDLQNIMSAMREKDMPLDENILSTLMQAHVTRGNIAEVENVMTLMKDAKLPMDKLYTEMAYGYALLGDIPNLVKILNDEPQNEASLLRIIKALSISDNGRHIPVVLNFLMASVPTIKPEISKMLIQLVHANRAADVHTIINCFALNEATHSHMKSFINCFLNELLMRNNSIEDTVKYASNYVDSEYDPLALINIAEIGLKLGRESLCLAIFKEMRKRNIEIRSHYYWPLLAIAHQKDGESKVFSLVKSMVDADVELDFDTLINYTFPYVNTVNPFITLQKLRNIGVSNSISHTAIISYLLSQNRLQDAVSLCTRTNMKLYYRELMKPLMHAYFNKRDAENCATMLTIFPGGQSFIVSYLFMLLNDKYSPFFFEDMQSLLEAFKKQGAKIPQQDATILKNRIDSINLIANENVNLSKLIDSLVDNQLEESAFMSIPHPRYMNSKELACLLVEQKCKGFSVKNTLRRLLQYYCEENNLEKAEEIKQQINANQYQWASGMKMYLFELYVRHNKLEEAETLLSQLQDMPNKFIIDGDKIVRFATMLVKVNRPKSAFDIIKKLLNVNKTIDMQRNCYILLKTLAHSEYRAYTKEMLQLLMSKNYCTISIELLRPLMAIPLEQNDILSAVEMFVECVQMYNKTPLAQELLTALLQERENIPDANEHLEKVYNIVATHKGPDVAATLLMIGLANLNKMEELQAVLEKQKISMNTVMHYFNYAQRINNIEILMKIFEVMPNNNNLDQIIFSDMILSAYSKMGDCDSALALWKVMCAKNVKPSKQFKKNFTEFLLLNKVSLPSNFEPVEKKINFSN